MKLLSDRDMMGILRKTGFSGDIGMLEETFIGTDLKISSDGVDHLLKLGFFTRSLAGYWVKCSYCGSDNVDASLCCHECLSRDLRSRDTEILEKMMLKMWLRFMEYYSS